MSLHKRPSVGAEVVKIFKFSSLKAYFLILGSQVMGFVCDNVKTSG